MRLRVAAFAAFIFAICSTTPPAFCANKPKVITTPAGKLVRRVYIQAPTPQQAIQAQTELMQNTCLVSVARPSLSDAVLELGIALPPVGGNSSTLMSGLSPAPGSHTLRKDNSGSTSVTANCSDNGQGCSGFQAVEAGDVSNPPPPITGERNGSGLDVSLATTGPNSQELWGPNLRSKRSWADQLRTAAGCPVCPGEHFDRKHYKTYLDWIQARCPSVMPQQ